MKIRDKCDNRALCGVSGHVRENGVWKRCACLQMEMHQSAIGTMFSEKPKEETPLSNLTDTNLIIEGPLEEIRRHATTVLTKMVSNKETFLTIDAYRLIEIFLDQDKEYQSTSVTVDCDLLIVLLGFGDPPNRYLPELMMQAFSRRELTRRPTWVVLGMSLGQVATRYGATLADKLKTFKKAAVQ